MQCLICYLEQRGINLKGKFKFIFITKKFNIRSQRVALLTADPYQCNSTSRQNQQYEIHLIASKFEVFIGSKKSQMKAFRKYVGKGGLTLLIRTLCADQPLALPASANTL